MRRLLFHQGSRRPRELGGGVGGCDLRKGPKEKRRGARNPSQRQSRTGFLKRDPGSEKAHKRVFKMTAGKTREAQGGVGLPPPPPAPPQLSAASDKASSTQTSDALDSNRSLLWVPVRVRLPLSPQARQPGQTCFLSQLSSRGREPFSFCEFRCFKSQRGGCHFANLKEVGRLI